VRNLLLIAVASVIFGGVGCWTDEAQQRREHEADSLHFWGGPNPDKSLGIEPAATDPGANKPAAPTTH
jgi:hypothetical protein